MTIRKTPRAVATSSPTAMGTYAICIAVQRDFSSLRAANAVKRILRRETSAANDAFVDLTTSGTDASSYSHVLALHPPACGILKSITAARVTSRTRCRGSSARKREPPIEVSDQVRLTPSILVKAVAYCYFFVLRIFVYSLNFPERFVEKRIAYSLLSRCICLSLIFLSPET